MDEELNHAPLRDRKENGIALKDIFQTIWRRRLRVIIWTCVFVALGLVAALTMKRTYLVSTVMVPQMKTAQSSSLGNLASLAGIDLSSAQTADLSPLLYPAIVSSVPFQLELMHTPLHFAAADTAVSMLDYAKVYDKPAPFDYVRKYTIGLPGVILSGLQRDSPKVDIPSVGNADSQDAALTAIVMTEDEEAMLKSMRENITLKSDQKDGKLTLTVKGREPIVTAELALKAQQLLQDEITRFRTEKAQAELDYIQARYNEVKAETESCQYALATITDRSQYTVNTRDHIERDRIQAKYNVANTVYVELAKQLETAKMQVKKDTPTFTVIGPVTVPLKPADSRAKKLILWTVIGLVLGCADALRKDYRVILKWG